MFVKYPMSSTSKGCLENEVHRYEHKIDLLSVAGSDGEVPAGSLAATECDSGGRRR